MDGGSILADALIVGGGPAGSAAAITLASLGFQVVLCEREAFPRERVGEALHPGVDSLLRELGVDATALDAVTGARFDGAEIDWAGRRRTELLGADADGPWLGRQVRRAPFDQLLLERAAAAGARVLQPCGALEVVREDDRVTGALTDRGKVRCRVLVDASGPARWLGRRLDLPGVERSPRLVVRYGYVCGDCAERADRPALTGDATGWTWIARVDEGRLQWVRLDLEPVERPRDWRPEALAGLEPEGPSRGAEMGWRITQPAGPGWVIAGDAAAQLDPTSSHGVLKALMSGLMAGRTAAAMLRGGDPVAGAAAYARWLEGWFETDVRALRAMYAELGAGWAQGVQR